MPFFENIPAYRPPVHVVTQPARKIPTLEELGIRVIENVKTSIIVAGLLAKDKVTVRDTGCGTFAGTGKLASWVTNELSVDKLMAQDEDCAETFEGTILQGMLAAGHATDSDLSGTDIEKMVRTYLEGGIVALTVEEQGIFGDLLDLAGVTRIVVTHRLSESLLRRFDGILVLKNGRLVESGDFETLMAQRGYFHALFTVSQ